METKEAVRALAALAQEHRLKIFRVLVEAGPAGLAAGELARQADIPPTGLSFHVKELVRARLARSWREGRSIRYALEVEAVRQLMEFLTHKCCQGRPELCGGGFSAAVLACDTVVSCQPPVLSPRENTE